ncbi:MAG: WD40 repeat domain-containing protein [Candidatus Obscuribacterales bacterium]|nr:WD40 repeat domain-containing protein [Candidatus Obscuribacterales bacterium]
MSQFASLLLALLVVMIAPNPGTCRWFTKPVSCVRFSPNGKLLLTSGRNNTVGLWNATTGEELKAFRGHDSDVLSLAFSRDGKLAASGSADCTVRIWDVDSGRQNGCFKNHAAGVNSVTFSQDGKKLLSGSADNTLKLWDVATQQLEHTYTGHTGSVNCVAFAIDGRHVISASTDKTIRIWDISDKLPARIMMGHGDAVLSIAVSPDGKSLVSGGADKQVKFWDLSGARERFSRLLNISDLESVSYSPDGKSVAVAGSNCVVRLLDAETAKDTESPTKAFTVSALVLTPGSKLKPSPAETSVERGTSQILFPSWSSSVSYSPDGEKIAIGGFEHTARICDISSGQTLVMLAGTSNNLHDLSFSADGKFIASTGGDGAIMLWDAKTGRQTSSFAIGDGMINRGGDSPVFSPDGSKIYVATYEKIEQRYVPSSDTKVVQCWDLKAGKCIAVAKTPSYRLGKVALSADGSMFATSTNYANVTLWDANTFDELHRFLGGQIDEARAIAFSPDDSLIASGGYDRTLQLWNRKTGQLMQSLTTYGYTFDVKFSPDGRFLACGGLDMNKKNFRRDERGVMDWMSLKPPVEVWRVSDGSKVRDLKGPGDCDSIVFSPDGKTLIATVGWGTTIYFWDFQSGKVVRTISDEHRRTHHLAISPDGKTLACDNSHFIERWDLATGKLLKTFTD